MPGVFITLPEGWASSTLGYAGIIFSDISPITLLIIGSLLAITLVVVLIRAFHHN